MLTATTSRLTAWKAAGIGGKEGLIHRLSPAHAEALGRLRAETRDRPATSLANDSFRDAGIDAVMAEARDAVMGGHGAIILSGLDIADYSVADFERIYWYLGTFFGRPVAQSGKGDLIGHVRHVTDNQARGYLSDMELGPHTDYHEILSLACVRTASRGGLSGLSSALAAHDELQAQRPDLLAALYEGYYNGLPVRYGVDEDVSDRKVPVFSAVDGDVSVFVLAFFGDAATRRGEPLPEKLTEALAALRKIAEREDMQARFMLEPGEMLFWNNRVNFHARTRFENEAGVERLLLRLWIDPPEGGRPLHPEIAAIPGMIARYHARGFEQNGSVTA